MNKEAIEIEKYLLKNKRQIQMAISHLNSFHGRAVRKQTNLSDLSLDNIFSKLILPLQISILGIEYNLLINKSYPLFKPLLDSIDLKKESLINKWLLTLKHLFKEKYLKAQNKPLTKLTIGDTSFHRYQVLHGLLKEDLNPFIELRNKLSHGQWSVAFNHDVLIKNQKQTTAIWTLSKKENMLIKSFINNIPTLFKLLSTSKKAFEGDYDKYVGKIQRAKEDAEIKYLLFKGD